MGSTQSKGDLAVAKAIADFTEAGYAVSVPLTESAPYDLIVDTGDRLCRVQVKYRGSREVDLRRIHYNSGGAQVKRYSNDSYDWLYVYGPEYGTHLIPHFVETQTITPQDHHRFAGVAESKAA